MKFKDLMIGDWFFDKTEWFCDNCVLMKISDTNVIPLNWSDVVAETADPDMEVEFCSKFTVSLEECSMDVERDPWAFEEYSDREPDFRLEKHFDAIPMYAIFKGQGQTYYKRIDESHTLVIWSPKQETMGKIFERPDWATHIGTYYICHSAIFKFPEDNLDYPSKKKSPVFSF